MSPSLAPPGVDIAKLLSDPQRVGQMPPEVIPSLLCQLTALQTALAARLVAPSPSIRPLATRDDRLLTVEEACAILGVTPRWLYRHQRLPFVRKLSRKALRVSEAGLRQWLAAKRP